MIKSTVKFSLLGLTALALAALPLGAAEKAADKAEVKKEAAPAVAKAEKAAQAVPFRGTLTAKTDASITIKERVFEVTSETKITKDGKPATLADGEIGKAVTGQYLKQDGKSVAKLIRFGGKLETPEKAKAEKVKKEKTGTKPEVKPEVKPETPVK
jgi:hypothetical protein